MYDILLITPTHRNIEAPTVHSREKLTMMCPQWGLKTFWMIFPGDALIGRARSIACTQFLENDYAPYMLFIDSDIIFEPEDVKRIYDDLRNGYDLVVGNYVVRSGAQLAHYAWGSEEGQVKIRHDGSIIDMEYVSTGFMGISKKLLRDMVEKLELPLLHENDFSRCYPFFECGRYLDRSEPIYISEDWDFCEKARKTGYKCYLDTGIQLGHLGAYAWKLQDVVRIQTEAAKAAKPIKQHGGTKKNRKKKRR